MLYHIGQEKCPENVCLYSILKVFLITVGWLCGAEPALREKTGFLLYLFFVQHLCLPSSFSWSCVLSDPRSEVQAKPNCLMKLPSSLSSRSSPQNLTTQEAHFLKAVTSLYVTLQSRPRCLQIQDDIYYSTWRLCPI